MKGVLKISETNTTNHQLYANALEGQCPAGDEWMVAIVAKRGVFFGGGVVTVNTKT